jgi:zinc transporter
MAMSGFAYVVRDGKVEKPILKQALGNHDAGLTWIHLTTNDERAQAWLSGEAGLSQYIIDALTAAETRPRCDAVGEGAVVNLRGLSSEEMARRTFSPRSASTRSVAASSRSPARR